MAFGVCIMHGTHGQSSSIITDAVTIISIISESNALLTFAIALHAVATGNVWVPPGPEYSDMARDIVQHISNPQWRQRAQRVLRDPQVESLARLFFDACIAAVPTKAANPIVDETWMSGVRAFVATEQSMQVVAHVIFKQFTLPDESDIVESGPIAATNPLPVVATPVMAVPARVSARPHHRSPPKHRPLRKRRRS